jgi:prepilin-type N-terminal cleavage/methylation domain-containing protein
MNRWAMPNGPTRQRERGFTVVELVVASAILLVVLTVVFTAVVEGQRSVSTIQARSMDADVAQSYIDEMALSVRGATKVSVLCPQSATTWGTCPTSPNGEVTGQMLVTYHVGPSVGYSGPPSVNYGAQPCTAWFFTSSHQLERSAWSSQTSSGGTLPTPSPASIELSGVTSGSFSYFPSYTGLVDISRSVLEAGSAQASSSQQASNPATLEAEVDNPYSVQDVPPTSC